MLETIPGGAEFVVLAVMLAVVAIPITGVWKVFEKAGENKYAALVPVYNVYIMTRIGGISPLWVLGWLVPYLNILAIVRTTVAVAQSFEAGTVFGVGMGVAPWIGWPLLGFGGYEYSAQ